MKQYTLKSEYIELIKLIKLLGFTATGGMAKLMVENGEVTLNGNPEFRKRAKIRAGDVVGVGSEKIEIL